jgi:hypothetical protein
MQPSHGTMEEGLILQPSHGTMEEGLILLPPCGGKEGLIQPPSKSQKVGTACKKLSCPPASHQLPSTLCSDPLRLCDGSDGFLAQIRIDRHDFAKRLASCCLQKRRT